MGYSDVLCYNDKLSPKYVLSARGVARVFTLGADNRRATLTEGALPKLLTSIFHYIFHPEAHSFSPLYSWLQVQIVNMSYSFISLLVHFACRASRIANTSYPHSGLRPSVSGNIAPDNRNLGNCSHFCCKRP